MITGPLRLERNRSDAFRQEKRREAASKSSPDAPGHTVRIDPLLRLANGLFPG